MDAFGDVRIENEKVDGEKETHMGICRLIARGRDPQKETEKQKKTLKKWDEREKLEKKEGKKRVKEKRERDTCEERKRKSELY